MKALSQKIILDASRKERRDREEREMPNAIVENDNYKDRRDYADVTGTTVGKVNGICNRIIEKRRMKSAQRN